MSDKFQHIKIAMEQGVATLLLSRSEQLNAMNRLLIEEVANAFDSLNQDETVKVIIFSGEGKAFCAGDDRKEHVHPQNEYEAREIVDAIQRVTRSIVLGSKPVVGAINGWAVGGGFEWAINCDFPIWARSARGFFPEVSLNLFVTGAVTSLLPALVGLNKAREMLFFGERYSADKLLEMGVAWKVVDDENLLIEAKQCAQKLAQMPELSVRAMKRTLNATAFSCIENAMNLETEATVEGFLDPLTTEKLKDF